MFLSELQGAVDEFEGRVILVDFDANVASLLTSKDVNDSVALVRNLCWPVDWGDYLVLEPRLNHIDTLHVECISCLVL